VNGARVAAGLLLLAGCREPRFHEDAWYRPPTREVSAECGSASSLSFHEVPLGDDLAKRLDQAAWVEVSDAEVGTLLGEAPPAAGLRHFVVRALYLQKATGGYSVKACGGRLLVHHGSLGHHAVPMRRAALLVELEEPPAEVFVSCSLAS
jgi:hypothetical protein